jgi:uncharacterized protein with FMN-binding domain
MKRVIFTLVGTVVGLVALLSYKTEGQVATPAAGLPSAGLPESTAGTSPPAATDAPTGSASTPSAASSSGASSSASYTGTAIRTRYGIVQVKVVVSGTKITNVSFVQLTAFDGRSQQINSDAAPILLQETLSTQSAKIDTVTGATYTSDGYLQSLQSAIDQAGIK